MVEGDVLDIQRETHGLIYRDRLRDTEVDTVRGIKSYRQTETVEQTERQVEGPCNKVIRANQHRERTHLNSVKITPCR